MWPLDVIASIESTWVRAVSNHAIVYKLVTRRTMNSAQRATRTVDAAKVNIATQMLS